jgi:predicted RNA-binding Zn-ribbon protein involved in translation (DUF1610 family)
VNVEELENANAGLHEKIRNDRATIETLRAALRKSTQALDDWTATFASEFCAETRVKEAHDRIMENGGTLAYIAGIVHPNHQLLKGLKPPSTDGAAMNGCPSCGTEVPDPADGVSPTCPACGMLLTRGENGCYKRSIFDDVDK